MNSLELTPEIESIARRVVWFEPPSQAISDPKRFLAYVMTYGDDADMRQIRQFMSDAELLETLEQAPAGIFDPRSWAYWNLRLGRYPTPPMPERHITAAGR